jgi:hypothetical protein
MGAKKYSFKCMYCQTEVTGRTEYPSSKGCRSAEDGRHVWISKEED